MKPLYFYSIAFVILFSSCDIRKNDKSLEKKSATASTKNNTEAPPTSVQIIDSVYDFKKIKEGDIVEFNYRFKNTGTNPLIVTEAQASCGCTVPEKPQYPITPGEIGFIKVKFNSDHRPGEAHKTIMVTSNARPEFPVLLLKGTVIGKTE